MSGFGNMITGELLDADGSDTAFETDKAIGATPTQYITLDQEVEYFELTEVRWYMNPTNGVTYQLYLLEAAIADNVTSLGRILFDSGAGQVKGEPYIEPEGYGKLPVKCKLAVAGRISILQDWSGAPSTTPGYIKVRGRQVV